MLTANIQDEANCHSHHTSVVSGLNQQHKTGWHHQGTPGMHLHSWPVHSSCAALLLKNLLKNLLHLSGCSLRRVILRKCDQYQWLHLHTN
jgi:uncharacterized protein (DUF2132 family)